MDGKQLDKTIRDTFNIPNHDETKALIHRPWQVAILNAMPQEVAIEKSRQLGLKDDINKMVDEQGKQENEDNVKKADEA